MAALAGRIMIFVYSWQDAAEGSFAWVDAGLLVDDETGHCRQVAVKRLKRRSELGGALLFQTASEAFARERALCVSLEPHDNVVRTIGAARVAGEPVLLLEYAHGPSLHELLTADVGNGQPRSFSVLETFHLLRSTARALGHLHRHARLVHCDVLPRNIFLDGQGRVLVSDLGSAAQVGRSSAEVSPLVCVEKPPEYDEVRARPAFRPSPAWDVWQLGYSAVAALAGRASLEATLLPNQTWTEGCVPKAALGDTDAAHALRMLLDAMLADDPDARPRDGRQLLERLESEPAFAGLRERLDARERLRTRLEEWHPEPTDGPDEVMRCLRGIRDRLRELEAGPLDRGRPLPDSHFLTAQAAWRAARTVDAGRELVRLAFEETEASRSAYHADARVLGLAVDLALSGAVRPDPVWLARLAHEQAGVHERRGSFVRTALLRRVGDAIEERGGRGDLALEDEDVLLRARQACGDAVVAFERGVLAHFRELESRVRWAS